MSLILHLSDSHLYDDPEAELKGVRPADSFAAVIEDASTRFAYADAIVLGGDMAQDEAAPTYARVADMVTEKWDVPIMISPGNHANLDILRMNLIPKLNAQSSYSDSLKLGSWQVITINTHARGSIGGFLVDTELERLETELKNSTADYVLIALHHHPVDVGSRWLDAIGLDNKEELWKLIAGFPKVKVLLNGHIHQYFDQMFQGVRLLATPSTCVQFKPKELDFALDDASPGYRWLKLNNDGSIQTAVERIEGFRPPDLFNTVPY